MYVCMCHEEVCKSHGMCMSVCKCAWLRHMCVSTYRHQCVCEHAGVRHVRGLGAGRGRGRRWSEEPAKPDLGTAAASCVSPVTGRSPARGAGRPQSEEETREQPCPPGLLPRPPAPGVSVRRARCQRAQVAGRGRATRGPRKSARGCAGREQSLGAGTAARGPRREGKRTS